MDVLVVDDETDIRRLVRRVVEDGGSTVAEARTGAEAVALAAARQFDVAVLDLHLPDMSGLDVLAALRGSGHDLHVIMLTGAGSESDRVLGLVSGADDYIVKPFSARELGARIAAVGRRRGTEVAGSEVAGTDAPRPGDANADASTDATTVVIGTTIVHANAAALRLLGADEPTDVVGHAVFEFVAPESVGATRARTDNVRAGRWPRPELITLRRRDATEVLVELASAPAAWEGQLASQVTMWPLEGDTTRLRELATGIRTPVHEAVIIAGPDLRVQSFNPAAEELYGWREEEVVGRLMNQAIQCVDDDEVEFAEFYRQLERDGRWHGEVEILRRDGGSVRVRVSATLLRDAAGAQVGLISVHRPYGSPGVEGGVRAIEDELLDEEIRHGIADGQFVVHYQPMVRLEDGLVLGVEALARWQHPHRGLLAPAAFIAAAERSGAIVELGQAVTDTACRQLEDWQRAGHDVHVSVNLSGRQLADPDLPDRLDASLSAASVPPDRLWVEVTETSLVQDLDRATGVLHRLAALGVMISIDDFGTGWASLTYLREFPVRALKIDRVFVDGLLSGPRDAAIVSSMVSLGRELGLSVVAEGIETAEQRDRLVDLGCVYGQGYFFGRPVPATDIDLSTGG